MSQANQDYRLENPEGLSWSEHLSKKALTSVGGRLFKVDYPEILEDGYIHHDNVTPSNVKLSSDKTNPSGLLGSEIVKSLGNVRVNCND
jgi:hypothetical protein